MLDYIALGLILSSVLIITIGIIVVHNLPGKIARKRKHPQAEAIHICSLVGLLAFPFWMVALIWAYIDSSKFSIKTISVTPGQLESLNVSNPETVDKDHEIE